MQNDCGTSDVESDDVVDVDNEASSVTDSELSVASSHGRQCPVVANLPKITKQMDSKQPKKTDAAKKKTPTKKTVKRTAKKKKLTNAADMATSHAEAETAGDSGSESSCGLEASVEQVADRFAQGCECRDGESCFININPESAYRHRLNIAELTRSEHDMYLMGVTMASLSNPEETARRTERKRLKQQYVFQVCNGQ